MKGNYKKYLCILIFGFFLIFLALYMMEYFEKDKLRGGLFENTGHMNVMTTKNVLKERIKSTKDNITMEDVFIQDKQILDEYIDLHNLNKDLFGWLTLEGYSEDGISIKISNPVMYSSVKDYYLQRDFKKLQSDNGLPYMDKDCFYDCGNYVIYGHNIDSMFGSLYNYKDKDYWEQNKLLWFNTLYEKGVYEIVSIFDILDINNISDFDYMNYLDLRNEENFDEYALYIKSHSLYDTEIELEHGDKLITLIGCGCHTRNGRIVVVARKIQEQEGNE